ncbi:Glucose-responsive transcription factor [Vermiconidia calcicola]|uniref:Glucose-responsive transcription factor n=1 Tax=Vermiconidia calcicola TaxID=1690605 RepID=A0ACC3MRG5_9PEZI|nr:Glucose-responsive transcription factor [Vermiconidia calcicola]
MSSDPNQRERYPSPERGAQQHSGALPFYSQGGQQQRPQGEHRHPGEQDGSAGPSDAPEETRDGRPQVEELPDDPALRTHLTNIMGGFNGYAPVVQMQQPQHHNGPTTSGAMPPGSGAFPQTPGSGQKQPTPSRTKVSRACDECRRKKIRCDAVDETGNTPCTSCVRTQTTCAFSRQPMKRGPSKGYIKELAERLNTLERQVGPSGSAGQDEGLREEVRRVQREMAQVQSMQDDFDPRVGDKRTHAVAEMLQGQPQTPGPQQQPPFPSNPYFYTPQQQQQAGGDMHPQPFWRHGTHSNTQEHTALSHSALEESSSSTTITNFSWDESVIEEYYRIIHQTFPLLPNNKQRLRQRLADCPNTLREAFLTALDCLMRTFPTTTLAPNANYAQALKKAAELLARYPFDNPSTHTNATNLVYLQTLLVMALECDNHGPATIRGQAGPSRAEWLGRAAGVAGQLEINIIGSSQKSSILDGDRDSEERLARRVWWVLFILDRWHASSTADLLKLPENSVVLLPEDQILLGESTYHLARLSFIIGHLASILTTTKTPSTDVMAPSNPASSLLGLTLAGEIDRFRESVESVWGSLNLVHLSYHHCHLLIKRLNPATEPTELIDHALKVATVLNSRLTPVTPLNHHFGALAAMTLCELCDVPKTQAQALKGLGEMEEALGGGRGLAGRRESEGWDGAVRELVGRKRERMQGMQGGGLDALADAAGGEAGGEKGYDPTMLTRYGYLTALGQGRFRTN